MTVKSTSPDEFLKRSQTTPRGVDGELVKSSKATLPTFTASGISSLTQPRDKSKEDTA